jgi:hypothetical protein
MAGGATTEDTPDGRCSHCLRPVPADLGVENSAGEVLCGACYFVLWGPKAKSSSGPLTEARRPQPRRDERGKPIWIPGPTGL